MQQLGTLEDLRATRETIVMDGKVHRILSIAPTLKNQTVICSMVGDELFQNTIHWIHESFYVKQQGKLIPITLAVDSPLLRGHWWHVCTCAEWDR